MKKKILVLAMALALVAVLAVPLAALAADPGTGTTKLEGVVPAVLELTAPSAIALGDMTVAKNPNPGHSADGNVNCNNAKGYILTVKDAMVAAPGPIAKGAIEGYMWTGLDGTTLVLASPLQVKAGTMADYAYITSVQTAKTTSAPSYNDAFALDTRQDVTNTDPAGSYSITLTFTATVNV